MSKIRPGNSANSKLNGEWGAHVKSWMKKVTSGKRRIQDKEIIREELEEMDMSSTDMCWEWHPRQKKFVYIYDYGYEDDGWDNIRDLDYAYLSTDSRFFAQF